MKRIFFISLLVFLFNAVDVQAANWYVRPSGGSGSGTSWTASWNNLSGINWSSVSCGDTIWVAGGTYTGGLSPSKNCTAGAPLSIRRARSDSSACTGAAGWSSGYNSTVQTGKTISFNGTNNYITISGRTTASGGGYGWQIINSSTSGDALGISIWSGSNASYLTFEYMDLQGPYRANVTGVSWGIRGINDVPYNGSSGHHTFSHMKIHGWGTGIFSQYASNHIFEYIDMYNISANGGGSHPNLFYIKDSNNGIIRYSKFYNSDAAGTGIAFSDGGPFADWQIYGNLFYDMNTNSGTAIAVQRGTITGLKLYNNTFSNNVYNFRLSDASCGTGSESKNNIVHGTGGDVSCGTTSDNLTTSDSGIFMNYAARDFRLSSETATGYTLSSPYNIDMLGNTRGGDGVWNRGAYEFNSGGAYMKIPSPPSLSTN